MWKSINIGNFRCTYVKWWYTYHSIVVFHQIFPNWLFRCKRVEFAVENRHTRLMYMYMPWHVHCNAHYVFTSTAWYYTYMPKWLLAWRAKVAVCMHGVNYSRIITHGKIFFPYKDRWKALKCKPLVHITDVKLAHAPQVDTPHSLAHALYSRIQNGQCIVAIQCKKQCISAMEQFQRNPHKLFDLRCPLSMWYGFQDKKTL